MFGLYRTLLAVWVMAFHLLRVPVIGRYAVFSFFVLSGFLMTTIMQESYGYHPGGVMRYAVNRFLRLYPMYWAASLLSLAIIVATGPALAQEFNKALFVPHGPLQVLCNLAMIYPALFPYDVMPRLSPTAWALTVELTFYFFIALGISRTKRRVFVWLILSVAYILASYALRLDETHRYASILSGSLPFALGASLYFHKERIFALLKALGASHPGLILSLYVLNGALFTFADHYLDSTSLTAWLEIGRYTNLLLSALVVIVLLYRGTELVSKRVDKWLGDFSYPIYLLHWQCALLASFLLFGKPALGMNAAGTAAFVLTAAITFTVAFVFLKLIDGNIDAVRTRIKTGRAAERVVRSAAPIA